MDRINRLVVSLLSAFILLASCQKKADLPEEGKSNIYSFRAVMETGLTSAGVSDEGVCFWEAGDQIAVYDEIGHRFCTFTSAGGDGKFTFEGEIGTSYEFTHAFYPASIAKDANTVTSPSEIPLETATKPYLYPMKGILVQNGVLSFKQLGALLKYTLIGIPENADALVLSSPQVSLSGDFTLQGDSPQLNASAGQAKVRIPLVAGSVRSLVFYLALPVGTYGIYCEAMAGEQLLESHPSQNTKEVKRARYITMRPVTPSFGGGNGTLESPFRISTAEDLRTLSSLSDDDYIRSLNYVQTADIDLGGQIFVPIGNSAKPFVGSYDGGGHSISGMNAVSDGAYAGLFGYLKGASVKDILICGASVSSGGNHSGAVAGAMNGGSISGCRVDGDTQVSSTERGAGGIVGFVRSGTISACASHASLSAGTDITGGIAGYLNTNAAGQEILVLNCVYEPVYKEGKLSGASMSTGEANAYMGGIAGSANNTDGLGTIKIVNCYAYPLEMRSSQVAGTKVNYIGGIVGRIVSAGVSIFNCLTPVTYSNVIIGGTRLNAKTYSACNAAACISGTVSQDGSSIKRVFSKNTWPVMTNSSMNIERSDIAMKMGESNMKGYGGFCFSSSYDVDGKREYSQADGGVLAALNDGVAAWNADNSATPALEWAFDPSLGFPKPTGVDSPGVNTLKISLLGDSISTYQGYIFSTDDAQMNKFYPDSGNNYGNMVLNEQDTWWWRIIYGKMNNARVEVVNAFGGSTVTYTETKIEGMPRDPNDRTKQNSLQKRYLDYGLGSPDILFYHGGRNDFGQFGGNTDVLLGSYSKNALRNAYNASEGVLFNNYSAGTVAILRDFHLKHPQAKILMIVHDMMSDGYDAAAQAIATYLSGKGFDIRCISLHEPGTNNTTNTTLGISKEGGTHPNSVGCANMADYIFSQLGSWLASPYQAGEIVDDTLDTSEGFGSATENYNVEDDSNNWF